MIFSFCSSSSSQRARLSIVESHATSRITRSIVEVYLDQRPITSKMETYLHSMITVKCRICVSPRCHFSIHKQSFKLSITSRRHTSRGMKDKSPPFMNIILLEMTWTKNRIRRDKFGPFQITRHADAFEHIAKNQPSLPKAPRVASKFSIISRDANKKRTFVFHISFNAALFKWD